MPIRIVTHSKQVNENKAPEENQEAAFPGWAELTAPTGKTPDARQTVPETQVFYSAFAEQSDLLTSPSENSNHVETVVSRFVRKPVPPPRTPAFAVWLEEARRLDTSTSPFLLQALERGTEAEQYAALLTLRQQGYQAYADGYDDDFVYQISRDGVLVTIKPLRRDE